MKETTDEVVLKFNEYLICEEMSENTIVKYIRDVNYFMEWMSDKKLTKISALEYKKELCERYSPSSVNAAISSLNCFFGFLNRHDVRIKPLRIQRQILANQDKELTKAEYERLLTAANKKNLKLYFLLQTICSTGIRISELRYITASAVKAGQATINCKGKMRVVLLPRKLCKMLKGYIKDRNIKSGSVFVTRTGKPLDRSYIWKMLKSLCSNAGVRKEKVFPHNLRHLFARTYYAQEKDIVRLAAILGHTSVNTTRIYTMSTGEDCRRQIQKLGLLRC